MKYQGQFIHINFKQGIDATDLQSSNADQQIDVNGPVISITLQNTNNLKQPVLFRFKHFNEVKLL